MLYLETVGNFLKSIQPLKETHPELFVPEIIEQISQPQRIIEVMIPWKNDQGETIINRGFRIGHSNVLGPFKGGLRFRKDVDTTLFKILAFEQSMKNSLAHLDLGGAKGGSNFDPSRYSEREIESFCRAFIDHMHPYFHPQQDVPAGDIGVSSNEIAYMVDQLKQYQEHPYLSFTGKPLNLKGAIGRSEATGYGLIYFTQAHLETQKSTLEHKRLLITGSGNVALAAAQKAVELGAKVMSLSDSSGAIYNTDGLDVESVILYKKNSKHRLADFHGNHEILKSYKELFSKPADIILPCATQNEIEANDIDLVHEDVSAIIEGSNKACTPQAVDILLKSKITYLPSKAANAGGVIVSSYEMKQNQHNEEWTMEQTMQALEADMKNIYRELVQAIILYRLDHNFLQAANIVGFQRIAEKILENKRRDSV